MQNAELAPRIFDLDELAKKQGRVMCTGFLSPAEQAQIAPLSKKLAGTLSFEAGYDGAERALAVITPPKFFGEKALPITYLEIRVHGDEEISHRDIMGAVMALGVKREMLGDIITSLTPPVMVVGDKIADYIILNLEKIGKAGVDIVKTDTAPTPPEPEFEEIVASVASLRLDSIVSEGFKISRSDAAEFIKKSAVAVNWEEQTSPSKAVKVGDRISLRGKGKILVYEQGGLSRKGRTFVTIRKYI